MRAGRAFWVPFRRNLNGEGQTSLMPAAGGGNLFHAFNLFDALLSNTLQCPLSLYGALKIACFRMQPFNALHTLRPTLFNARGEIFYEITIYAFSPRFFMSHIFMSHTDLLQSLPPLPDENHDHHHHPCPFSVSIEQSTKPRWKGLRMCAPAQSSRIKKKTPLKTGLPQEPSLTTWSR